MQGGAQPALLPSSRDLHPPRSSKKVKEAVFGVNELSPGGTDSSLGLFHQLVGFIIEAQDEQGFEFKGEVEADRYRVVDLDDVLLELIFVEIIIVESRRIPRQSGKLPQHLA